jgi:hypothetical protein
MLALSKIVRFYMCLLLAITLGMAGTARASHEGHAPAQIYFSTDGQPLSSNNCLSIHVDKDGSPVNPVHIHGCANCLIALDEFTPIPPIPVAILQLVAPKRLNLDPKPLSRLVSAERRSPHAARAPPLFS